MSSNDALALLVSANLFVDAVKIANVFKIDVRPVSKAWPPDASTSPGPSRAKKTWLGIGWRKTTLAAEEMAIVDQRWQLLSRLHGAF